MPQQRRREPTTVNRGTGLALLWLVVVLVAGGVAWRGAVNTDLFALLPGGDEVFVTRALGGGERRVTLLIRALDAAAAQRAAAAVTVALADGSVLALQKSDPAPLRAALLPFRFQLLSDADRALLQRGDSAALEARALALIGGPEALGRITPVADDPLGTLERFLRGRFATLAALGGSDQRIVVLQARVGGNPFDLAVQDLVLAALDRAAAAMRAVEPDARLLRAGAIFHAAANASAARTQTAVVGTLAAAVVLVLAFWLFRRVRPVALVMVPVVVGGTVAFGVAFLVFTSLHVITLVFGATLIGLASDYAFHFLVARDGDDRAMVRRLAPTLFCSAACTALAYGCLALAGMRALSEVALIGAVGLLAAVITVVLWFPLLCRGLPLGLQPLPRVARWWRARTERTGVAVIGVLALVSVAALAGQGKIVGDARALDGTPAAVRAETAAVLAAAGGFDAGAFALLQAPAPEALLRAEERLRVGLDRTVAQGALTGYLATSSLVPSFALQQRDYALLASLWSPAGTAEQFVSGLGAPEFTARWRAAMPAAPALGLSPARLGSALDGVWLGSDHGTFASVIRLAGIADRGAVQRAVAAEASAQWVDVPLRLGGMFQRLAELAAWALVLAVVVVATGLVAWRRSARAALGMVPVAAAVLAALAVSCIVHPHLNLFHLFGAFLVLGFGTDSVVVQLTADDEDTALGIIVSQLTTGLDFAALTLIDVPAVRALGMVVAIGTLLSTALSIVFRHSYRARTA